MDKECVIMGGGIVGIFSAIVLKEKYKNVTLIEHADSLGGILNSYTNNNSINFDYGTHIPAQTMIKEVDDILFKYIDEKDWNIYESLKVGSYSFNKYNPNSAYVDTRNLAIDKFNQGIVDLLKCMHTKDESNSNLEDYLIKTYGATFTKEIYDPIIYKLLGRELKELNVEAFRLFEIQRLIIANYEITRELKKFEGADRIIAYPKYTQGKSASKKFYPKNNVGIKKWIEQLEYQARMKGVKIKNGCSIQKLKVVDKEIKEIILNSKEILVPNEVIWAVPINHFLVLLGDYKRIEDIEFRSVKLFNIVTNKMFLTQNQYLYCFDDVMKTFRVTIYPNLDSDLIEKRIFNCTVEVLCEFDEEISSQSIIEELITMGIINKTFIIKSIDEITIPKGFPIITKEYLKNLEKKRIELEGKIENIAFLGKARGTSFFMRDTILEAYERLK